MKDSKRPADIHTTDTKKAKTDTPLEKILQQFREKFSKKPTAFDLALHTKGRFPVNYSTKKFLALEGKYNAVRFQQHILPEGPDPAVKKSAENFLKTFAYPRDTTDIIIALGPYAEALGEETEGLKFADYFIKDKEMLAEDFFKKKLKMAELSFASADEMLIYTNSSPENKKYYVINFSGWQDQNTYDFQECELQFLATLAIKRTPLIIHCCAGVNRSPALALILKSFELQLFKNTDDADKDIATFMALIKELKDARPYAVHDEKYITFAYESIVSMHKAWQKLPAAIAAATADAKSLITPKAGDGAEDEPPYSSPGYSGS